MKPGDLVRVKSDAPPWDGHGDSPEPIRNYIGKMVTLRKRQGDGRWLVRGPDDNLDLIGEEYLETGAPPTPETPIFYGTATLSWR